MDTTKITAANRTSWNASAAHHQESATWRNLTNGFATSGFSTFDPTITALLNSLDLQGKSVVQVGCNNGREVLSLATFGAVNCLGIDQSDAFLDQARELAGISGSNAQFLCANIYALPENLPQFDVALITIGVLNWMPDLPAFFTAVAGLIRSGGTLLIYETHPFLEMYDPQGDTPFIPAESYFRTDPYIDDEVITYDGGAPESGATSYWFTHKMADILNACIGAGLAISKLQEYPHSNREVDYDKYENHEPQIPMCFSLKATLVG